MVPRIGPPPPTPQQQNQLPADISKELEKRKIGNRYENFAKVHIFFGVSKSHTLLENDFSSH